MISRLLTDFYKEMGNSYIVEHLEGTVEEISNRVAQGLSEIGIVYIAQKQLHQFQHILSHKKLKFVPLDSKEACVYVGPKHPRYHDESIDFQDLSSLSFVRGVRDFFLCRAPFEPCEPWGDQHRAAPLCSLYQQ